MELQLRLSGFEQLLVQRRPEMLFQIKENEDEELKPNYRICVGSRFAAVRTIRRRSGLHRPADLRRPRLHQIRCGMRLKPHA